MCDNDTQRHANKGAQQIARLPNGVEKIQLIRIMQLPAGFSFPQIFISLL